MQQFLKTSKSLPAKLAMFLIRCYQVVISPHFPGTCRFEPTCSQYGIAALEKYGLVKGLALTAKRISKCHPGGAHGYDPVP